MMKPTLVFLFLASSFISSAQSLDYIAVKKKNGNTIKNFYTGSPIVLQTVDGSYVYGPIKRIQNDTVSVLFYDIRYYPTTWGTYVRDTIATQTINVHHRDIQRIQINTKKGFVKRNIGPLLMIAGGSYFTLNILNGALFDLPITDKKNLKILGISAGAFGLGYLFNKLFKSDGFSKKSDKIVYVDL